MWLQKFTRPKGFSGSLPRNWIDDALPVCPFCLSDPEWEFGLKAGWINRYHFRCTNTDCMVVLSINVPDVAKVSAVLTWGIGTTKQKMMKLESEGHNTQLSSVVGSEFTLGDLQQMSEEPAEVRGCNHCNSTNVLDAKFCTECGEELGA